MYGMVNVAMQQLITSAHGESAWERIKTGAGCDIEYFGRMDTYDDALTYALVGAAVSELGTPADQLLRQFGKYWVEFAMSSGYGEFFRACNGYESFIAQLDAMHTRLQHSLPELRAPQFSSRQTGPDQLEVTYRSHRSSLAPFVLGLLEGLGVPYQRTVEVTHLRGLPAGQPGAEDVFLVNLK